MSANKILEVLCLNGRRQKVKISSGSSILQVLQEVCKKQGLNEAEVDLIYHRKVLDVTTTMRYTNIPNNAKLEMIKRAFPRKATNVNVALQTDFDQRLQHEFSPSLTLYEILKHWESHSEGMYKGKIICKVPVVIHMTQEICGIKNLKDTTLESLGLIRGNIVLRLVHREEETCGTCSWSEDAVETAKVRQEHQKVFIRSQDQAQPPKPTNADVTTSGCDVLESAAQTSQSSTEVASQKENSVEPSQKRPKLQEESSVENTPDVGGVALAEALKDEDIHRVTSTVRPFQQFKFPDATADGVEEVEAVDPKQILTEERLTTPCQREALVFNLNNVELKKEQMADIDESFYDVTIEDIRMRIHSLKTEASEAFTENDKTYSKGFFSFWEETPLMTKNMRRTKDMEKAMRYKKEIFNKLPSTLVIIRVQFPDKFVLQGVFRSLEPVGAVKQFVREHLQNSVENLYLYTTPPKCLLKDDKQTLHQAKLIPAALVHVSSTQSSDLVLRNRLIEEAVSYLEAENKAFYILKKRNTDKKAPSLQSSDVSAPTTSSFRETTATEDKTQRKPTASEFMPSKAAGSSDKKVPKWFR